MKKSIIFLINGLGIEKPGSYSISIDQEMPNLAKTRETSFFTTAFTNSLEYRSAYQQFYIGDTYNSELEYIKENVFSNLQNNQVYQNFLNSIAPKDSKLHIFIEPTTDRIVDILNNFVNNLNLENEKKIYLHLILPQFTTEDYKKLIDTVNYIKYHINEHINLGFIIGKEYLNDNMSKDEMREMEKMLFYCSCERWTRTDEKLLNLQEQNIIPCKVKGFCATNECFIKNNDTIFFFNTRRNDYDRFIRCIYEKAPEVMRGQQVNIPIYSLIQLYSRYSINYFAENIVYNTSLNNLLKKYEKKALILTSKEHVGLVNFYANGLNQVNNPDISFMVLDDSLINYSVIANLIDNTPYDLIIFDYFMDVSSTINNMKFNLNKIDKVLGNIVNVSENRHSLFISSLFGLKKELPIADYNTEKVTIDYEMQIPIFFYDYTFPASKYRLFPGETNMILYSALWCLTGDNHLDSLVKKKGLFGNLF